MPNHLIFCDRPEGYAVFHIALRPDGTLEPVVNVVIPFDAELLAVLLRTDRPGGEFLDQVDGTGYFFAYDNSRKKPYPSVMIWKYHLEERGCVLQDVEERDLPVISYAVETYLKD